MAPPKASLPLRVLSADFLGINWNKISWMAPYSNFYPLTVTGGHGSRLWSSWLQYGHFHNRANRIIIRNAILGIPSVVMATLLIFMMDWYQCITFFTIPMGKEPPQWAQDQYRQEMVHASWHKPGAMHKHHLGGGVSIPGSEKLWQ